MGWGLEEKQGRAALAATVEQVSVMSMYNQKVWGNGHVNDRVITPATLAFLERWELFMPKRYNDGTWRVDFPPHRKKGDIRWSIGFGHTEGGDHEPIIIPEDMELTLAEARELLLKDVSVKARWVDRRVPLSISLTTYMYGALVSLVYQYGQGRVDKAIIEKGWLLPHLLRGQYVAAFCDLLKFDTKQDGTVHPGLTLRRASEVGFLMTKIDL
jgi:GH24 family phage-related lysozyme (muramidase)